MSNSVVNRNQTSHSVRGSSSINPMMITAPGVDPTTLLTEEGHCFNQSFEIPLQRQSTISGVDEETSGRGSSNNMHVNSFHIQSITSSTNNSMLLSSIRDVITHNERIYWFSCITGMIKPQSFENITGSYSKHNVRLRIWGSYLYSCLFLVTIGLFILGIVFSCKRSHNHSVIASWICLSFGISFQNAMIYPAIWYLRREIDLKREDVNRTVYEEAFEYSIQIGTKVCISLFFLLFLFIIVQLINDDTSKAFSISVEYQVVFVIIQLLVYSPFNFLLTGLFTFLVMEQRISFMTMNVVKHKMEAKTLTDIQFLQANESIKEREKVTPINWLLSSAVISTLFGIAYILIMSEFDFTPLESFSMLTKACTTFGRQTIVLIVFLMEIAKVNEIQEEMIHHLAKTRWNDDETKRLNLYVVMKELPMGSTIFYYRPSKLELLIQIGSSIVGVGFAVFWAIVFA